MAETYLGWYMPTKNVITKNVKGAHFSIREIGKIQWINLFEYWANCTWFAKLTNLGQLRVAKKSTVQLKQRRINCYNEAEQTFAKRRINRFDRLKANFDASLFLSEYMDTISRLGHDLLSIQNANYTGTRLKWTWKAIWNQIFYNKIKESTFKSIHLFLYHSS